MPVFTHIAHERFVDQVRTLAHALKEDGWSPTYLIGLGRGGLAPAVYLSHATGLPMLSVDLSADVHDFGDAALALLAARTRSGEQLLFVDDINDSGRTIARLRGVLAAAGAVPGAVRFATLIDNVSSDQRVEYRATVIDRRETKDWFVFPWEALAPDEALAEDAAEVPDRIA